MKLSKTQQELLDAMKSGEIVRIDSSGSFYRQYGQPCTAAANGLIRKDAARIAYALGRLSTLILTEPAK